MIAPALTIGLNGRLLPGCSSIELKASPLGSTPTRCSTRSWPELVDRHPERERLGDRLDGERAVAVAGLEDAAVAGDETNAEIVWVRLGQFRNVGRDLTIAQRLVFGVNPVHQQLHFMRDRSFQLGLYPQRVTGAISVPRDRAFSGGFRRLTGKRGNTNVPYANGGHSDVGLRRLDPVFFGPSEAF